jgi:hypothetical protein
MWTPRFDCSGDPITLMISFVGLLFKFDFLYFEVCSCYLVGNHICRYMRWVHKVISNPYHTKQNIGLSKIGKVVPMLD